MQWPSMDHGHKYFSDLFKADKPAVIVLGGYAAQVQARIGGLYVGMLDCVRSSLCNSALGVDSHGCCLACCAIRQDAGFQRYLSLGGWRRETPIQQAQVV